MNKISILLKPIFFGVALALILPPYNLPPYIAFLIFIPILSKAHQGNFGKRFITGFGLGFGYFVMLLKWLEIVGVDALLILSALCALWWALSMASSFIFRDSILWPIWFATTWTTFEILRDRVPWGGFGWGQVGIIWVDTPFSGLYASFGQVGMTMLTYLIVALLFRFSNKRNFRELSTFTSPAISLVLLLLASLASVKYQPIDTYPEKNVKITAIQGGVEHTGLGVLGEPRAVLNLHLAETYRFLSQINASDLLIWPESSVDLDPYKDRDTMDELKELDASVKPPVLVNATLYTSTNYKQNISLVLDNGSIRKTYQKRHLVPFGEFLPIRSIIEKYTSRAELLSRDYLPGKVAGEINVKNLKLGILICFEIADDSLVFENISQQSAVVVQTNNATYQNLGQTEQQLLYTRMRAIETGRPIVSISTSGTSAIVEPSGEVTQTISQKETGLISIKVHQTQGQTIATLLHRAMFILIFGLFCSGLIIASIQRIRIRK